MSKARKIVPTFKNVILCDDVRQEKNNKYILIGVFSGDIVVSEVPATLAPQLYIEYFPAAPGVSEFEVRISMDDKPMVAWKGNVRVKVAGLPSVIVLPPALLEGISEGKLRVEAFFEDAPPILLLEKGVRVGEVATSPTVSPPPSEQFPPDAPAP